MSIRINGDNTAANPGITGTDTDTGLSFGTNEVSINTDGTERFRVGSSGELGIGGATYGTSGQVLTSQGSGSAPQWSTIASDSITEGNTSAEVVDTGSDGHFKVVTEGTDALRVDASQRVLIRTTGTFDSGNGDAVHIASTVGANVLLGREDTSVSAANNLGMIRYFGQHGGTWRESARIQVTADGGHTVSSRPGKISFLTTTATQNSPGEQMALDGNGDLQFNSGYGSVATAYGCRAWVNFQGTGTVSIRDSGNVSSISDNGAGDYNVNFTTAMPDDDYAITGSNVGTSTSYHCFVNSRGSQNHVTTSSVRFAMRNINGGSYDQEVISIAIFR
jgi:hypothetical protein